MNRRKAILILSALDFWSMGEGKGGPALWQTLSGYARGGWKVCFITSNYGQNNVQYLPNNMHVFRFDALFLKKLMKIKKFGFFFNIVWLFWSQILFFVKSECLHRQYKFVIVYGYEISVIPIAKALSKLWHVPMVSRFQGTILIEAMKLRFWKVRMWDHFLGLKIPSNLLIMTNDGTQGESVLKKLGVNMVKVRFWMNGVDLKHFNEIPGELEARKILNVKNKNVLLTVCRLVAWKHVERSINALPDVVKYFPDTVLLIVGDGPKKDELKQLVYALKIEQHVRFIGAVPHEEISKYFAAADIFLSFYDLSNVGNPLLEAMISGKCIVTLNNGDTGKFINNEHNGILLENEDIEKISQVIKSLLGNDKLRNQLGLNAKKSAKEHFWTWKERMNAEIQAVENLLK